MRAALLCLVLLAGCARFGPPVPQTPLAPSSSRAGYDAGCASGEVAAGHPYRRYSKDSGSYESDAGYRASWDEGFIVCKGRYEAIGRAMQR